MAVMGGVSERGRGVDVVGNCKGTIYIYSIFSIKWNQQIIKYNIKYDVKRSFITVFGLFVCFMEHVARDS